MEDPRVSELGSSVDAFAAAFDQTHGRLWRALLAYTGDRELASDASAEAFTQALRRGEAIRDVDAWVWRAAFRIASGELARRRQRGHLPGLEEAALMAAPDLPEPAAELISALGQVTERQRQALILRYVGGYTAVEIAARLGTSPGSVRVSLLRGRRALRDLLEDTDG